MDSFQKQMLRETANMDDDLLMAMAVSLESLAGRVSDLADSIRLCEPSDEGAALLARAAEFIALRAATVREHPEAVREAAARRLRSSFRLADASAAPAGPASEAPSPAFWRLFSSLARDAAAVVPGPRDSQTLRRVLSIAERQLAAAEPGRGQTGRLTLVPRTAPNEAGREERGPGDGSHT